MKDIDRDITIGAWVALCCLVGACVVLIVVMAVAGVLLMGYRVDKVKVTLTVAMEFAGIHDATFEWVPTEGDPLVEPLLAKLQAVRLAAVDAEIAAGNLPNPMDIA